MGQRTKSEKITSLCPGHRRIITVGAKVLMNLKKGTVSA
jgi:hypothetical protein